MTLEIWSYYLLAILILTASPGPSVLLCLSTGVTRGLQQAFFAALGSLLATTGILTLSFAGLGAVIVSSDAIFHLIKWVGAVYLIYLGLKLLLAKQEDYTLEKKTDGPQKRDLANFFSGFLVGVSNPKAILFFTALFPQFIDPQTSLWTQYLIFVITFVVLELAWLMTYAYLGVKSSSWIFAKGRAKLFNRLTASVFITAGALLSSVNRS
ncbi:Threonine/homoserine/homoserine lactone efflux protein [Allopseudospirillum japonicum]|uniref:Threonine/homoserine/homoserine lactone efflux protein n=1 Tax=Allopseudospirillum japonicum TaxID=64971 RepID=A0A1H6S166_9GAMM|nr:LysE family translocator [Allopseudospirillum japonicum]SEI59584.1 Threonine/homoserine/homoserine lactone efflux protein [Allopseudospirillum japonicum]